MRQGDAMNKMMINSDPCEEGLVTVLGSPCHQTCLDLLRNLPNASPGGTIPLLPKDIQEHIVRFLVIRRIQQREVSVSAFSSNEATLPVGLILQKNPFAYWVSGYGTMPGGRGHEFIEFDVSSTCSPRRVRGVTIGIPSGPLSVREFRIDHLMACAGGNGGKWVRGRTHVTQDREGEQSFQLEQMDAYKLRLVCLSNHASIHAGQGAANEFVSSFNFVGLWTVTFI